MADRVSLVERLRLRAVERLEAFELEEAVALFDAALALCEDEETRERVCLGKASALVEMEEDGPEVQALPAVLMRRRNPKHTTLAAHCLQVKALRANELEVAERYGRVAMYEVDAVDDPEWRRKAKSTILNDLGWTATALSRFEESIRYSRRALATIGETDERRRAVFLENIGYCYVQLGFPHRGIRFMTKALQFFRRIGSELYCCETLLDLCNGYVEIDELDLAREAGRECMSLATEPRQVRNCHYLLGEIAIRRGERHEAKRHFNVLAAFYPGFVALPDLLLSFDVRPLINFKL